MMRVEDFEQIQLVLSKNNLPITPTDSYEQLLINLSAYINHLITNDFSLLISLLYRLDISEEKLQTLLQQNQQEDAGTLIAQLIIERQMQVIEARRSYTKRDDISEEEKW